MTALTLGLIGNPNSGKTTLFNQLTGSRQRVGNWAGVTVERKEGAFHTVRHAVRLVDLPGTYSLTSVSAQASLDEQIACRYIASGEVDVLVNVVDAANLERNLYLTVQLREMGIPCIVALNMLDIARSQRIRIDIDGLARRLGCPVVPLVSTRARWHRRTEGGHRLPTAPAGGAGGGLPAGHPGAGRLPPGNARSGGLGHRAALAGVTGAGRRHLQRPGAGLAARHPGTGAPGLRRGARAGDRRCALPTDRRDLCGGLRPPAGSAAPADPMARPGRPESLAGSADLPAGDVPDVLLRHQHRRGATADLRQGLVGDLHRRHPVAGYPLRPARLAHGVPRPGHRWRGQHGVAAGAADRLDVPVSSRCSRIPATWHARPSSWTA